MRSKFIGVLALALLGSFLYLLLRIATLPLESGEAYPAYSTLRADPRGSMALYESLAALKELRVERNFQPLNKLKGTQGAIFLLGETSSNTASWSEQELKFYESLAAGGARLVIAFLPEPPHASVSKRLGKIGPIATRWHLSVESYEGTAEQRESVGSMPRETWAYFQTSENSGWEVLDENDQHNPTLIMHRFGKGEIVLLTESYPLSNEGLRAKRNVELVQLLAGSNQQLTFDESHLGVTYTGSVGALIRRYRLTGAFAVTLLLGLLFLWKNASSLVPQTTEPQAVTAIGADAQSGLVNLLKRSVPATQLAQACWDRWKDTRALGRPISEPRVQRAERELASADAPAAVYRKIQQILTEKT